ncbi:MAG TPA: laccase [Phycisphaerales bacterium]|nr:laccase [Phycisphaerales bacterium]
MVLLYNKAFRDTAAQNQMNLLDTARLLAMGNMVGTDILIAGFDTKYNYSFWRPITAIRRADTDGNPATDPDPMWMPLIMTPNHPEYVAGHSGFTSAQAEVFADCLGTTQIEIDLSSTVTGTTRHYATVDILKQEVIDARTWGGVHYRGSSIQGVTLGQQLAQFALQQFFTPAPSRAPHAAISGGIRKFVDSLPGLGFDNANNLGQYIPVAIADVNTYRESDYYEIAVVQYQEQMHSDLPPTLLRGYVQLETAANAAKSRHIALVNVNRDGTTSPILLNGQPVYAVDDPHYMGPMILATKNKPARILFRNLLPTGLGGDLFIPVDTTVMGAGMGPDMSGMGEMNPQMPMCGETPKPMGCYSENRATLHLHGGITPWISDGTPHQWITPAGEDTVYPKGVSVTNVPDMPDPGPGAMTFFYSNQQSARLLFYHDHSWGITRLNVYAGEAAGYLIADATEQALINKGIIPDNQIPLIIQDKTFVPNANALSKQDPTWDSMRWGGIGDLWVPHVYMPAQNPGDSSGVNQFGRWAYGPWFWPPTLNIDFGPIANPYYDANCNPDNMWCEPPLIPGVPFVSMGMEAFNDTPVVNGTAYPTITLEPKAYRFRILNAANDRFFNLSIYKADANGTEVFLNPAEVAAALDDPAGVFPTPVAGTEGPSWIQIGTEGGFLPAPVLIPPQPTTWVTDPTVFNAGNVDKHSLLLGPAERADVIVDFSAFAGQTLILYNDAPAAFPARDPRYDYYTGNPDLTDTGGAPPTLPGYGPNIRTVMQIKIAASTPAADYNLAALENAFAHKADGSGVFESSQNPIIVGQSAYNSAYGTSFNTNGPNAGLAQIFDFSLNFKTLSAGASGPSLTMPLQPKAIQDEMGEAFEKEYGRMSGNLGLEVPLTQAGTQQNLILYPYVNPASEIFNGIELPPGVLDVEPISSANDGTQLWKITHNGVDTHPIHFHLFDIQLINRVGWDGIIRRPELNELGWKDTVRISPLEDTIVAMRPIMPKSPFGLPDSIRPLNPMMPVGSTAMFNSTDAYGNPINPPITNEIVNFGWEYVWHCHILSHEEMDMMRPMSVNVSRFIADAPVLTALSAGTQANLSWTDGTIETDPLTLGNPKNEIGFRIERADVINGVIGAYSLIGGALANQTTYSDTSIAQGMTYSYRVIAFNAAGDSGSNAVTVSFGATAPAAPTNLAAALQTMSSIGLSWTDNANNETGFTIQRATNASFTSGLVTYTANANATSYLNNSGVSLRTTYYFRVRAINSVGTSAWSNTVSVRVAEPADPTTLTAMPSAPAANPLTITLNWIDTSGIETGFVIQRATNNAFTANLTTLSAPANTSGGATSYVDNTVVLNTLYYYRVRAVNGAIVSAWTNTASASVTNTSTIPAPTNLVAMLQTISSINLTWTDNATNETGYTIQRATNSTFTAGLVTYIAGANAAGYLNNSGVALGTTYYFRVRATNAAGTSAWSNTVLVRVVYPADPTTLTATPSAPTANPITITLQWTDTSGIETGFVIQRATNSSFTTGLTTFSAPANTAGGATSYVDNSVVIDTLYYYRVQAVNGAIPSLWTNTASATVGASTPVTVIIDNGQTGTFSTGTWAPSGAPNPYGTNSVWSYSGATYTWSFTPAVSGTYRVSMWWTALASRSTSVPVRIWNGGTIANLTVNQTQNGGMWNVLGQYPFNAGTTYRITITAPNGSPPSTSADAVRFEKM